MFNVIARRANRLLLCCLLVTQTALVEVASAQAVDDVAKYPEIGAEVSLPRIFAALRRTLKDPGSISDFALCPQPKKIKLKDGKPIRWTYLFSLNARNGLGGYMGLQPYAAVLYADGRTTIDSLAMPGNDGFAKLGNDMIERDMAKCPYLSKDRLRALLDGNQ